MGAMMNAYQIPSGNQDQLIHRLSHTGDKSEENGELKRTGQETDIELLKIK
jgi:hypothetical protein